MYLGFPLINSGIKGLIVCANGGVFASSETVFNPK